MNWRRIMPGLSDLLHYKKEYFWADFKASLSVSAVAIPVSMAYSELLGLSPIVGLYASILPLIAYALLATSKQVIVGPDTATCAVIAAIVVPMSAGNRELLWQLTIIMTLMTGIWCLLASRFHLGAIADFLSRPILAGVLNGLAFTIILGQIPNLLGISLGGGLLLEKMLTLLRHLSQINGATLSFSLASYLFLAILKKYRPNWPASLFLLILSMVLAATVNLSALGIHQGTRIDEILPFVQWPGVHLEMIADLVLPSFNLAVISFVSLMLTARSFAVKNGYEIEPNQEFRALGVSNIVSALSQGFAISGTSSRTAINDTSGGKTQMVSLFCAVIMVIILLFLSSLLSYIPSATLSIILISSSLGLIDIKTFKSLRKTDRHAYRLALFTLISVLLLGVIVGIGLAVLLGLLQFLRVVFRPTEQILGIDSEGVIVSLGNNNEAKALPGILMYRFNSPLTYFNVAYFKRRILNLVLGLPFSPRWVVIDAVSCFTHADISVLTEIDALKRELMQKNVRLVLAGRRTELLRWFHMSHSNEDDLIIVTDLYIAVKLIQSKESYEQEAVTTD